MEPDTTKLDQDVAGLRADSASPPLRMSADNSSPHDIFARHQRLVEWVLTNNGYFHPDAQIAFSSRKGFHALVASGKTISSGTRIAGCPMPLTISILNALDVEPFSSHGTRFPKQFLIDQAGKPDSLQAFFLMEQLVLGDKSWWAPYISSLPTVEDVNNLQFNEESDLAWLDGTNLKGGYETQSNKWRMMYQYGLELLKRSEWPHALDESYTWYVNITDSLDPILTCYIGKLSNGLRQSLEAALSHLRYLTTRYQQIELVSAVATKRMDHMTLSSFLLIGLAFFFRFLIFSTTSLVCRLNGWPDLVSLAFRSCSPMNRDKSSVTIMDQRTTRASFYHTDSPFRITPSTTS